MHIMYLELLRMYYKSIKNTEKSRGGRRLKVRIGEQNEKESTK